ncbi:MAG: universal stress protein [Nocardioidaceae bacterium]|nr:MAG: universal stress protein [Nocardioidaceae bacterium]
MNENRGPVLACIDGSDDSDRAIRYALEEAGRLGTTVRLLHVVPELVAYAPGPDHIPVPGVDEAAQEIVKAAIDRCHSLAPDIEVSAVTEHGSRVKTIVDQSETSSKVIIGTRPWRATRVVSGSTTAPAAAHAHCPVVAVPQAWTGETTHDQVMVGVDEKGEPTQVLRHAFEAAHNRGADLVVVHGWSPPGPYVGVFEAWDPVEWTKAVEDQLTESIQPVRQDYPDVNVEVKVLFGLSRSALAEAGGTADLLIVGRHRSRAPWLNRLGSVAHRAVHTNRLPVEVVPLQAD